MITHDKKDCPLRFDIGDDDPNFPDDYNDESKEKREDEPTAPIYNEEQNTGKDDKNDAIDDSKPEGNRFEIDPTMVAGPSSISKVDNDKSFSLIVDRDLTAKTWYYLKAKMAKGKFTDEEFLDLIHQYSSIVASKGCITRPRESENCYQGEDWGNMDNATQNEVNHIAIPGVDSPCDEDFLNLRKKNVKCEASVESHKRQRDEFGVKIEAMSDKSAKTVMIPGLMSTTDADGNSFEKKFPNLLQGLEYLKNQSDAELQIMINRFKETHKMTEYVDPFGVFAFKDDDVESKRRRIEVKECLSNTFSDKENQMDLFLIRDDSPESSMGSFEVVQRIDGGAGSLIPPSVP